MRLKLPDVRTACSEAKVGERMRLMSRDDRQPYVYWLMPRDDRHPYVHSKL
jgi:hypothetical protein